MKKLAVSAWAMILALVVVAGMNPMINMVVLIMAFLGVTFMWMIADEKEHKNIEKDGSTKEK